MSDKFSLRLSTVIREQFGEQAVPDQQDLVNVASELLDNISQLEKSVEDAKLKVSHILEELTSSLGREIRKIQPKMNISLKNGACGCGYHSRDISCKPDLSRKVWVVSGRLGNGFKRTYPEVLKLSSDMRPIAQAIVEYFKKYYRSL